MPNAEYRFKLVFFFSITLHKNHLKPCRFTGSLIIHTLLFACYPTLSVKRSYDTALSCIARTPAIWQTKQARVPGRRMPFPFGDILCNAIPPLLFSADFHFLICLFLPGSGAVFSNYTRKRTNTHYSA